MFKPSIKNLTQTDYKQIQAQTQSGINYETLYKQLMLMRGAVALTFQNTSQLNTMKKAIIDNVTGLLPKKSKVTVDYFAQGNTLYVRYQFGALYGKTSTSKPVKTKATYVQAAKKTASFRRKSRHRK